MSRRTMGAIGLALVAVGFIVSTSTVLGEGNALSFTPDTSLKVTFQPGDRTKTALVQLINSGDARSDLKFSAAVSSDGKTPAPDGSVSVTPSATSMNANTSGWITLTFSRPASDFDGFLVATSTGAAPAVRPIALRLAVGLFGLTRDGVIVASLVLPGGPGGVLLASGFVSLLLLTWRLVRGRKHYRFGKRMGKREWKWSESWASTFTTVGGIFGTILGAGLLSDDAAPLGNLQFASLNVFFVTLLVVSGFVFDVSRDRNGRGLAAAFFLTSLLMFLAVFGELFTLYFLIKEAAGQIDSNTLVAAFEVMTVVAAILIGVYGNKAIDEAYRAGTRTIKVKAKYARPRLNLSELAIAPDALLPEGVDIDPAPEGSTPEEVRRADDREIEFAGSWSMP